jgi:hypothetical protein
VVGVSDASTGCCVSGWWCGGRIVVRRFGTTTTTTHGERGGRAWGEYGEGALVHVRIQKRALSLLHLHLKLQVVHQQKKQADTYTAEAVSETDATVVEDDAEEGFEMRINDLF